MATLDFDEFRECLARCARDKYGEIKLMTLAQGVRGVIQNILGEKSDEAVIRDAIYIHAERYDWKLSEPLPWQSLAAHRRWLDCWQNIEIADLHHFPLWEKGVFDCLRETFGELIKIFAHYSKSIGGSITAEDAVRAPACLQPSQTLSARAKLAMARCMRSLVSPSCVSFPARCLSTTCHAHSHRPPYSRVSSLNSGR